MSDYQEYNPLDYNNLTNSVVRELMGQGPFKLPLRQKFRGAGVYALFYIGKLEVYVQIRSPDAKKPIYVGKAVPRGARKGSVVGTTVSMGTELFDRISQHVRSIQQPSNLVIADFLCRYLVVTPLWITMAERFLIEHYRPLWNTCVDGFGIHDPGSGRHAGECSVWDVLHPGRPFAARLKPRRETADQIAKRVVEFLSAPKDEAIDANLVRVAENEDEEPPDPATR